jgi:Zn-dependent metalloprotease
MHHRAQLIALASLTAMLAVPAAAVDRRIFVRQAAVNELAARAAQVAMDPATGSPRLVRISPGSLNLEGADPKNRMLSFFERFGEAFGIENPARNLELVESAEDQLGMTHLSFSQVYEGLPIFGAELKAHFNRNGELVAVNGAVVPDIAIDPSPTLGTADAAAIARAVVAKNRGPRADDLEISTPVLCVYRKGLIRGVPGANHLAWEVEVSHLTSLRDYVYVDAHDGQILNRISAIHQITRNIYHHEDVLSHRIWTEGDALPYSGLGSEKDAEVNEIITATREVYDLFSNLSGGVHLSPSGHDSPMGAVYEPEESEDLFCPNAWAGRDTTYYCFGVASDETIGHEWTHSYGFFTHNLIHQWQPGALSEGYADIFGEMLDIRNRRGLDEPSALRDAQSCSVFGGGLVPSLTVHSPAEVARVYDAGLAEFNPLPPWTVRATLELADDGTGITSDACENLGSFTPGRIALIDRGSCPYRDMVINAFDAGAVAAIIANNEQDFPDRIRWMAGDGPRLDIPAFMISYNDGVALKAVLDQGVEATFLAIASEDNSLRWLIGEDDPALGTIRDMWHPECFSRAGRSGSRSYWCYGFFDDGGTHSNCGVPSHAFALLVDGGRYNGRTISPIGWTRAAHIYWRAMSVWETPTTRFPGHADALELSCEELINQSLADLETGLISSEVISASDCDQVAAAMLAVEMRDEPLNCALARVLAPNPPPVQPTQVLYSVDFSSDPGPSWARSNQGVYQEYDTSRNWRWTHSLPAELDGGAMWAENSSLIGDCLPGSNDQSGVLYLESPVITVPAPASQLMLVFDHYVATEEGWDGGNLKISINGGPWELIPGSAFIFNNYNWMVIESGIDDEEERQNTNPLAGEPAYTGGWSEDEPHAGWGQSQIDLGAFADGGDTVRIRFDFGNDGCTGGRGWYVANFKVLFTEERETLVRRPSRRIRP